jgi:hypothetical protein
MMIAKPDKFTQADVEKAKMFLNSMLESLLERPHLVEDIFEAARDESDTRLMGIALIAEAAISVKLAERWAKEDQQC